MLTVPSVRVVRRGLLSLRMAGLLAGGCWGGLALAAAAAAATPPVSFQAKVDHTTAAYPAAVAMADLNRDGKLDAVVAAGNGVSVLLGNGHGLFQTHVDYVAGGGIGGPRSVAVADFNRDGKPDLVAALEGGSVSVLAGRGDGTFQASVDTDVGAFAIPLVVTDLNRDGKPDVAVGIASDAPPASIRLLWGKLDGTLFPGGSIAVPNAGVVALATADLNRDGKPDLIVAPASSDASVGVLLGNGDGTFQPRKDFPTGLYPIAVAVADLNGDGKPDLIVVNDADNTVSVLLGRGDGTFEPRRNYATGRFPSAVAVADLNRDGKLDLVVTNESDNTVSVLLGRGDGTFEPKVDFRVGSGPDAVAVGDVDGDGRDDLIVANGGGTTVSVLLNSTP